MNITLHKGGEAEQKIELSQLQIPDLWHIETTSAADRAKILECWHIAHDLKRELFEREDKPAKPGFVIWQVVGLRKLPDGGTIETTSISNGSNEAAARSSFDRMQIQHPEVCCGHAPWLPSELTFTQVQQK
jgi:hypothetical protein